MSSRIKNLIQEFGFTDGSQYYIRLKLHILGWFTSSKKKIHFFLRNNKTDAGIFKQVFIDKQYEIPIHFEPQTIIDAGANIGLAALYFAGKFPHAKIVALEPDTENFELAKKNTQNNSRIIMLQKGVWDKETYLEIVDDTVSKDAFMVKESKERTDNRIEAITLDAIMQQQGWQGIDILKIDIEGAEKEVFSGNYQNWLPYTRIIFVEVHDGMKKGASKAVFNAISKYNFSFSMKHENLIFINEDL